jgi:hypothetical protein
MNWNNWTGFNQGNIGRTLDDAQSPIKETMAWMTQESDLALITHQEDSILDSSNRSTNKTPTVKDTATETNPTYQPPSSAQFRIPVKKQRRSSCIAWQTHSLYEELSQCRTHETVLVLLCAYSFRKQPRLVSCPYWG